MLIIIIVNLEEIIYPGIYEEIMKKINNWIKESKIKVWIIIKSNISIIIEIVYILWIKKTYFCNLKNIFNAKTISFLNISIFITFILVLRELFIRLLKICIKWNKSDKTKFIEYYKQILKYKSLEPNQIHSPESKFKENNLKIIKNSLNNKSVLWLHGHKGTGKTFLVKEYLNKLNFINIKSTYISLNEIKDIENLNRFKEELLLKILNDDKLLVNYIKSKWNVNLNKGNIDLNVISNRLIILEDIENLNLEQEEILWRIIKQIHDYYYDKQKNKPQIKLISTEIQPKSNDNIINDSGFHRKSGIAYFSNFFNYISDSKNKGCEVFNKIPWLLYYVSEMNYFSNVDNIRIWKNIINDYKNENNIINLNEIYKYFKLNENSNTNFDIYRSDNHITIVKENEKYKFLSWNLMNSQRVAFCTIGSNNFIEYSIYIYVLYYSLNFQYRNSNNENKYDINEIFDYYSNQVDISIQVKILKILDTKLIDFFIQRQEKKEHKNILMKNLFFREIITSLKSIPLINDNFNFEVFSLLSYFFGGTSIPKRINFDEIKNYVDNKSIEINNIEQLKKLLSDGDMEWLKSDETFFKDSLIKTYLPELEYSVKSEFYINLINANSQINLKNLDILEIYNINSNFDWNNILKIKEVKEEITKKKVNTPELDIRLCLNNSDIFYDFKEEKFKNNKILWN